MLDRVTGRGYPSDPSENLSYVYDRPGSGLGIGRLTSLADTAGTLKRTHDERGSVISEARTFGTNLLITGYTYGAASRIVSITYLLETGLE